MPDEAPPRAVALDILPTSTDSSANDPGIRFIPGLRVSFLGGLVVLFIGGVLPRENSSPSYGVTTKCRPASLRRLRK